MCVMPGVFRVIIAGPRQFKDYELLKKYADFKLSRIKDRIEIVSCGALGADRLGEKYAREKGYLQTRFSTYWNDYAKNVHFRKNDDMMEYSDALIAFSDGEDQWTKEIIEEATRCGLRIGVKYYTPEKQDG